MNKNALAVAVGAGLAAAPMLSAQAVEVNVSGHINRTIIFLDNGADSGITHADNDSSSSRVRFTGSEDFGGGKVGFTLEHQFESNSTARLDIDSTPLGTGDVTLGDTNPNDSDSIRKVEAYFSAGWGKVTLGQGSDAIDGITEIDLSGVWAGGIYAYPVDQLNVTFTDNTGFQNAAGTRVQDVVTSFDGGRRDRIRYDSPSFAGGINFAVSHAQGDRIDLAVRGSHGENTKFAWGVGLSEEEDVSSTQSGDESLLASGSLLLANGLNFTVAFSENEQDIALRDDGEHTYFKIGYKTQGKSAFAFDFFESEHVDENNGKAEGVGIGWDYQASSSVRFYASWREVEYDAPSIALAGQSFDDATAMQFGTRVVFK